jgi:hypothetical protein
MVRRTHMFVRKGLVSVRMIGGGACGSEHLHGVRLCERACASAGARGGRKGGVSRGGSSGGGRGAHRWPA